MATPAAVEAGGMEVIATSRPQPGALSLETPGGPRHLLVLSRLGLVVAFFGGAVGGLSEARSGCKSLIRVPSDALLVRLLPIGAATSSGRGGGDKPSAAPMKSADGVSTVSAAVNPSTRSFTVFLGCLLSSRSWLSCDSGISDVNAFVVGAGCAVAGATAIPTLSGRPPRLVSMPPFWETLRGVSDDIKRQLRSYLLYLGEWGIRNTVIWPGSALSVDHHGKGTHALAASFH